MSSKKIDPQDKNLKGLFQDFYRVPDYQREYVWGETDAKGIGGEEVDQYLDDIHTEYQNATKDDAPEYFIGTLVVCRGGDDLFDLIDGQQRTTTTYITLCAIRDALKDLGASIPDTLSDQIAAGTINWQGETERRLRLDLQYEDARGVLATYAEGGSATAPRDGTRSIRNIWNAYETAREFIRATLHDDPNEIRRFYGYLTNKVKVIRIETPTVAMALKIFETINARGVGLDAMDLLKNLLFMHAKGEEFSRLKAIWKDLTDAIYSAGEKPLRFLRYYMFATYDLDSSLREDGIYDWFQKNASLTGHASKPITFAERLLEAAKAYANFARAKNKKGDDENGLKNTQLLGGKSVKQHFIILLAGRHLSTEDFSRLADEIEKTMFVWLVSGTPGKDYERKIIEGARQLRGTDVSNIGLFIDKFLVDERASLSAKFQTAMTGLRSTDLRHFRLRYLLAKITQYVDLQAYGPSDSRLRLIDYTAGGNDIEHILAEGAHPDALSEFGEGGSDQGNIQSLGNLLLIEKAINRSISNGCYSGKSIAYAQSKFLLTRCQADVGGHEVGKADRITKTVQSLQAWPTWSKENIKSRQAFLTKLALRVWDVPIRGELEGA